MARNFYFKDFNKKMTPDAVNDLSMKTDDEAVKDAVRNFLLCAPGEIPLKFNYGFGGRQYLAEPMSMLVAYDMEHALKIHLPQSEPRVSFRNLNIRPDYEENSYRITVEYAIIGTTQIREVSFFLQRLR